MDFSSIHKIIDDPSKAMPLFWKNQPRKWSPSILMRWLLKQTDNVWNINYTQNRRETGQKNQYVVQPRIQRGGVVSIVMGDGQLWGLLPELCLLGW